MGAVIGIDLGTTNTVVAAVRDGHPVALPDENGSLLIPSIVSFLPSGAVLVGSAALERRAEDVRNTVYSVKRLIGRTWDSAEVAQARSRFPFELREGPGRATFVIARGETYTLPEISAFVLRKAKSIAELELGEPVDRAVITVPANFNDLQRAATKVAGRVAGLEVLRIINEPTAAALAFGPIEGKTKRIAVYDFGGGTFDFTLLRLTDDVFEVLATSGDTFLGGDDIDGEIVEQMADRFIAEDREDPRVTPEGIARLRDAAEQLKLILTHEPDATVRLSELGIVRAPDVDFLLTRRDLDSVTRPIVEKTFGICKDALAAAKLAPNDVDDVLLVGGSTKDPYVRKRVREFFGKAARCDIDPHLVVALGAARQAQSLTQLRATASGIPVPPPPRAKQPSDVEFRQKTQPFGQMSPVSDSGQSFAKTAEVPEPREARTAAPETGLSREQTTEAGLFAAPATPATSATSSTVAGPAPRISVVPPEGPVSHPVPTTRDLAKRDRRTTGVGLGPTPQSPELSLPLVSFGEHSVVVPEATAPVALDATLPPSTLSGLGPKGEALAALAAAESDLPAAKPPQPPMQPRSPMVRVAAGTREQQRSAPDLSQTLSSAGIAQPPVAVPVKPKSTADSDKQLTPTRDGTDPFGPVLFAPPNSTATSVGQSRAKTDPFGPSQLDVPAIAGPRPKPREPQPTPPDIATARGPIRGPEATPQVNEQPPPQQQSVKTLGDTWTDLPEAARARATAAAAPGARKPAPDGFTDLPLVVVNSTTPSAKQKPDRDDPLLPLVTSPQADARLPLVTSPQADTRLPLVTSPQVDARLPLVTSPQADARLPLVTSPQANTVHRRTTADASARKTGSSNEPLPAIIGSFDFDSEANELPALEHDDDEPTVIRRSKLDSVALDDTQPQAVELPELGNQPQSNAAQGSRPASLNEEEIRARYGNLPLIVGGRRMGVPLNSAGIDGPRPFLTEAESFEVPQPRSLALPKENTLEKPATRPAPAPLFSLEPEALVPESEEQPLELEEFEPKSSRPAPGRFLSSRPAARQDLSIEAELPIPDLPPSSRRVPPAPTQNPVVPAAHLNLRMPGTVNPVPAQARLPESLAERSPALPPVAKPIEMPRVPQAPWNPPGSNRGRTVPTNTQPETATNTLSSQPIPVVGKSLQTAVMPVASPNPSAPSAAIASSAMASSVATVASTMGGAPQSRRPGPALLIDVTPLSLCVETAGGYIDVLVQRNTPVPCERTRDFVTVQDNQDAVVVRVAQGESLQFAENVLLGEVQLSKLPLAPRGQTRISVTFGLDSDGMLQVRAMDVASGNSSVAQLALVGAPTTPELQHMMARHKTKS